MLPGFVANHKENVNIVSKLCWNKEASANFSRDFKGFATTTSGYTPVKVADGKLKTLEAIETINIISNRYYDKILSTTYA